MTLRYTAAAGISAFVLLLVVSSLPTTTWAWSSAKTTRPMTASSRMMNYKSSTTNLYMVRSNSNRKDDDKRKNKAMLNFIEKPAGKSVGDWPPPESIAPEDDPLAELVRSIVKAADGRKADNIVALRVSPVSTMTSFLVILTGNSRPQNQAIAAAIMDDVMEEHNKHPQGNGLPEGSAESGWMLLDYGSVMVHIMTPKSRLFYNIEGQWREKGGEEMDVSDIIIPNKQGGEMTTGGSTMEIEDAEEDPFWS